MNNLFSKRIAVLACGPSLKQGWHDNKAKEFDAVVAVNTAAWRYGCDWLVFSDTHVERGLTKLPRIGVVTNSRAEITRNNAIRPLPIGESNTSKLTPAMRAIAEAQGMGQCGFTLPNALRFAAEEWPGCDVTLFGFDCSELPCVGGMNAPGSHDADRWARELPWVRECFRIGTVRLDDSCQASPMIRDYLAGTVELADTRPLVLVPFFPPVIPDVAEGKKVRALLNEWRRRWDVAGSKLDCAVITERIAPHGWGEPTWVNTEPFSAYIRAGQTWDMKGALVLAALLASPRPLLVMDADAWVMDAAKFDAEIKRLAVINPPLAMVRDEWAREIESPEGKTVRQRQAGVMWFGGGAELHKHIVEAYLVTWPIVAEQFQSDEPWLEQLVWSAVWADMGGHELPAVLNVSHYSHVEKRNKAAVVHWHGPSKWTQIPNDQPAS